MGVQVCHRHETMGFNSSAVIAGVLGSLLVVGIVLVVTNSNDVNAPAEAQQTELMWGDNSAPLGLVDGWNTSVGTAAEREAAARHFHVTIADDDSLWKHNVFTPFAGKTLKMVGIDIKKRNAFNTLIEYKVKQGNVAWTVEPGPQGVWGPMVEHIDGKYTGTSRNAGYASPSEWIESDYKVFLGHKIENDWGLVNATSWDKTTVVIDYQSYQKGHFIMTWQLPKEGEVEPTELDASFSTNSRPASCSKCSPIQDPSGAGSYDKGIFVPKTINRPGVYVPNDDPAETNGWCLDCSYPSAHDECKAAGCAIGPPPPAPKYSNCIDTYINGETDCKVCAEDGKVCVNGKCLDCYAKENDEICGTNNCGPYCGGGYTPVPGDPGYNPNPGVGHCRSCSQDGSKVCADSTGLFGQIECLDCKNPLTNQDRLKCEISMCSKRKPHEKCAKGHEECDPGDTAAGIKIIECCEGLQCVGAGRQGYLCV